MKFIFPSSQRIDLAIESTLQKRWVKAVNHKCHICISFVRRFWETDIRNVRRSNRSTIRRKGLTDKNAYVLRCSYVNVVAFDSSGFLFFCFSFSYENLIKDEARNKHLESALQQALKEAADDQTFRKVKRLSYSANDTDEVSALRK